MADKARVPSSASQPSEQREQPRAALSRRLSAGGGPHTVRGLRSARKEKDR
jgi:hypothetical protein